MQDKLEQLNMVGMHLGVLSRIIAYFHNGSVMDIWNICLCMQMSRVKENVPFKMGGGGGIMLFNNAQVNCLRCCTSTF